jgi:hypothetical protein
MNWITVEGFGNQHIVIPGLTVAVCNYRFNPNCETATTDNLARDITCVECLDFAKVMQIPTA